MFEKIKNEQVELGKKVHIFGASQLGKKLFDELKIHDICVDTFLDNDKSKQFQRIRGVRVEAPERLKTQDKDLTIVIIASLNFYKEMKEQIKSFVSYENVYSIDTIYMKYNKNFNKIAIPNYNESLVSVILTVYNQWNYTYNCLDSFVNTKTKVPYEIIIGDNNSTDETKDIEKIIVGAKIIHRSENIGYLRNVNATVELAQSKYILILQNDTYFIEDYWLDRLVEYMEENPKCGAVAPYMCGYDGKEGIGGCMLENDGNVIPIVGKKTLVPYSVMYIQPAAVLCRNELWRIVKGYDEAYMPAWCEDEDFYLKSAELGYDLVICPNIKYIHYGSKTYGACPVHIQKEHLDILVGRWGKKIPIIKKSIRKRNQDRGLGDIWLN